jgi:C_GCAxxG_C_C family probable redox protein
MRNPSSGHDPVARARQLFLENRFYCAESVLLAVAEHAGIESDLIPAVATGFCSGLARTGGMCGALQGGIMALGMLHGRTDPDESPDDCYGRVQALILEFTDVYDSANCNMLLGCDLTTPEGREKFRQENLAEEKCAAITEEATRLVLRHSDVDRPG